MSWNGAAIVPALASLFFCSVHAAVAADVCPSGKRQPLRFVDVYDGPPEELASLVPDQAKQKSGYWKLAYVYDAGRFVTIRCKYADGETSDVKLADKVRRCDYRIDAKKALRLHCE